jgi:hypothetical protein
LPKLNFLVTTCKSTTNKVIDCQLDSLFWSYTLINRFQKQKKKD